MMFIEVPDRNDSISSLSIDGREYLLRFTYNETYDYWSFGLYGPEGRPIVAMTKLVPNFPVFHFYRDVEIPDGVFGCLSDTGQVGRRAFVDKTAEFVYIPRRELEG